MRFAVVSRHLPEPEGSAAGRVLLATCGGLRELGHEVAVWSWSPKLPAGPLPPWCTWQPLPTEPAWRTRGRALVRPRADVARARWHAPDDDAIAVADDPVSYAAVASHPRSVLTVHYASALDARLRPRRPADVQDRRAERSAVRGAALTLAYSGRVAAYFGSRPIAVPIALELPATPLPVVEAPVAVLLGNVHWLPNALALRSLQTAWPLVQARVPGARLLVAGPGTPVGPVAHSVEMLGQGAVLAFPCPPSSGPKVKVLESLGYGVPVVTTPAGVEGLALPADAAMVVEPARFADALAATLADPELRARLAAAGRAAVLARHAPLPAAAARVAAVAARWPELTR